ncbi:lysylphosphatidylglycerol synthase transmembrane domain-containing protein [Candidatus Nitrosotenuis sp. DW1]|uniref:lysylphosphatidylglycerol synthase transmembrane domain-containing protein n=1 Tax=Candidatus Nitrosotenuis sp. DW1 TaxID=2259672 RepID=UPI0015CBC8DA|nr:lysylphosphatidylglycerol synthase transmembrane domain-containing protein [Candidatus Nitrosotenuis sp. DW1]QLH09793.1 TIGR00374 family protein [Candidatus Nitrosotenuis sp. DW1]
MNWRIIAFLASLVPFLIIAIQFNIKPEDIFAVGIINFLAAFAAIMLKLFLQGVKFHYIIRTFHGSLESLWRTIFVRIGSEFVTMTTPMFVGGEVVRIYWMKKRGMSTAKASWLGIFEIITEVLAAGVLSILAGVFALVNGYTVIGIVVLAAAIPIVGLWIGLFFLSSKRTFHVPKTFCNLIIKFRKEKGVQYIEKTNEWMNDICTMSRENFQSKQVKKAFFVTLLISFAAWGVYGISFMLIAESVRAINPITSIFAVMAGNAIGNLPITVGGSGLTEFGIWAYLNHVSSFALELPQNNVDWNTIIAWRIATYQIPIPIAWFLLMKMALRKYNNPQ